MLLVILLLVVALGLAALCVFECAKRRKAESNLAVAEKQIAEDRKYAELLVAERDGIEKKLIECEKKCDTIVRETEEVGKEVAALIAERDKIASQSARYAKEMNRALKAERERADDVEQHLFRNWTMISNDGRVRTYMRDCIYMYCDGDTIVPISDKENDRITAIVENDEIAGYYRPDGPADVPDEEIAVDTENAPDVNCMPDDEDAE